MVKKNSRNRYASKMQPSREEGKKMIPETVRASDANTKRASISSGSRFAIFGEEDPAEELYVDSERRDLRD